MQESERTRGREDKRIRMQEDDENNENNEDSRMPMTKMTRMRGFNDENARIQ